MSDLHLMLDADSIVVRAAMASQTNYVVYKDGRRIKPTKSKLQWTKDHPDLNPDDYEFREEATLIQTGRQPAIDICKYSIIKTIKKIEREYSDRKVWVCLEASGNFRDELYPNYKGNRKTEILLRKPLVEWIKETFPRVILAFGCETDDIVARHMWKGYKDFQRTGVYTYMAASCDKDLRTVAGLLYNYCKDEETEISELEADRWFCEQLLQGDDVDGVKGINGALTEDFAKAKKIRYSSKGVGKKTAENLLKGCKTSKECFEVVIEAYKNVHGDKWLAAMKEEGIALRMQHYKDERYDIQKHLEHLGIDCAE